MILSNKSRMASTLGCGTNWILNLADAHDGRFSRAGATSTHSDVLYQAYFTAYMVLSTIGAPREPGKSLRWLQDAEWLWHVWWTRLCGGDHGCRWLCDKQPSSTKSGISTFVIVPSWAAPSCVKF